MQTKREPYLERALASFILATIMFIGFFAAAYSVSYINYQIISSQNTLILASITELDKVLAEFKCEQELLVSSSERLDEVASKITLLEKRFGKKDSRVLEQKKLYSELEYRHYQITLNFNGACDSSYVTALFFYSNINGLEEFQSERMGFILTAFEREDADRVMIYSFDYDLESETIASLVKEYNITEVPSVVVDNKVIYVRNLRDVEPYLN